MAADDLHDGGFFKIFRPAWKHKRKIFKVSLSRNLRTVVFWCRGFKVCTREEESRRTQTFIARTWDVLFSAKSYACGVMLILNCGPAGLGRKTRAGEGCHGNLRKSDESTTRFSSRNVSKLRGLPSSQDESLSRSKWILVMPMSTFATMDWA